jgi:hypothetical protein
MTVPLTRLSIEFFDKLLLATHEFASNFEKITVG